MNRISSVKIPSFALYLLGSLGLVVIRITSVLRLSLFDDAYITMRFADNLARGLGFVFNPLDHPVFGITCPLYGLIQAAMIGAGLPVPAAAHTLNLAAELVLFNISLFALNRSSSAAALCFALLYGLAPSMNRLYAGGMEINLSLAAAALTALFYSRNQFTRSVLSSSISVGIRPENALLVLSVFILNIKQRKKSVFIAALLALSLIGISGAVLAFYFGQWIPQSILAKAGHSSHDFLQVLKAFFIPDRFMTALSILAAAGSFFSLKIFWQDRLLRLLALYSLFYIGAYLAASPVIYPWYRGPAHYFIILTASLSLGLFIKKAVPGIKITPVHFLIPALAVSSAGALALRTQGHSPIDALVHDRIKQWAEKQSGLEGKTILAYDIGAIGYYSRSFILDGYGLVWKPGVRESMKSILQNHKPDYLFLNANTGFMRELEETGYQSFYTAEARFGPSENLPLRPDSFQEKWSKDYLLFKRRT